MSTEKRTVQVMWPNTSPLLQAPGAVFQREEKSPIELGAWTRLGHGMFHSKGLVLLNSLQSSKCMTWAHS